ncbi:type II toxin-antitoxin system RelE/ParE family toxin [Granulicella tundricola]|uniref:Plasmid maintenance system killer n=1 Tax=Granulicella tundricola (strain ATCC BAA-1859 / DSM 23138 / MP5ACTX9) TaxID=1198114 RepID=E8X288_GRATM|nr:type II toxin-antitoxin system RelE/ParE family toxin [Granulicella tundricola]ADW68020.1 plasmid maintenance system killer [Granulicella tundricola MP5ACTX9]
MIRTFADRETERIFSRERSRRFSGLEKVILRKLSALHAVRLLSELAVPLGNHLEALKGDRKGQHSIRVNQQYRICFRWEEPNAFEVEIVDYH